MDKNRAFVENLCDLEIPALIKISPNRKKVVYSTGLTWAHMKGKLPVTKIWLATVGEANSSKQITDGTYNDHSLAWHPLKDEFAFVSDRAGNATKSAIYTMSLVDLTTPIPITPTENEQAIEKFKFSPDGKMIAFISKDEKTAEEKQRDENKEDVQVWGEDVKFSLLRIIDLETRKIRTLQLDQHVLDLCWISKGSEELEIGFISCDKPLLEHPYYIGTHVYTVEANLKEPRKICSVPRRANDLCWGSVSDKNDNELYFHTNTPADKAFCGHALYKANVKDKSGGYEQVIFEGNHDITALQSVNGHIIVKVQHRLEDCLIWVGKTKLFKCKQEIEAYDVALGPSDGQATLAVATSNVNTPIEVYSIDTRNEKKIQLSQHGATFHGQHFGTCTVLSCPTTDHHKIEIDGIFLEPTSESSGRTEPMSGKNYPTLVLIHGGPSTRHTNAFNTLYYMWTPYLLSLGYGLFIPNYRGSSGRGPEFSSISYNGVGVHAYADIIALTQYAIEKGYSDPDRLILCGVSHGGLLANLGALRNGLHNHDWKFKAVITVASQSEIDTMALTSDMGYAYQTELHNGAAPWTMSPEDTSTRAASALWLFKEVMERSKKEEISIIPPILILHGANDERCHVSNAWGLRRALEHYSLPFEMAIYPRQGHMFHEQKFWIDMALRISRWVERYIGPGIRDPATSLSLHGT